ncbi:cytochrome c peroxidase [Fistulifera solaris]|uniref:Cytochrome c peroxidase, mitochondrial n=1 Tax=Fistulifera solaris TaxID=1519565 RepID=A0A1Z5JX36_FISSO|nr:cytochrome c peroxidase [Fistulifera solaris]|eukprot:GAX18607.1 cytochrome c peroxidase [Fistulifera solaris]
MFSALLLFSFLCAGQAFRPTTTTPRSGLPVLSATRRDVLASSLGTAVISFWPSFSWAVDYKEVAKDIEDLVRADPDKGPTLVRLAWHSSGTYDQKSKTGGSGQGTIRFAEELAHGGNAGLKDTAVQWLEPIHAKYDGLISYADLYTLAGVAAIHAMGGPVIPWSSGRVDALDASAVTPDGRLPNADSGPPGSDPADAAHVRAIFNRMGFNDQEIVALSGAHALGRCHTTASGYDGPWTPTPTTFNNAYFTILKNLNWVAKEWDGPYQYVNAPGGNLMMLPSDLVLLQDKKFKRYVDIYAGDADKFYKDFAKAFQTLEELGTSGLTLTAWV